MYLRSASDWHLDPLNEATIERYIETIGKAPSDVEPLSLGFYLSYCEWFQKYKNIKPLDFRVAQLEKEGGQFLAHFGKWSNHYRQESSNRTWI